MVSNVSEDRSDFVFWVKQPKENLLLLECLTLYITETPNLLEGFRWLPHHQARVLRANNQHTLN
jgi:hypothetical protein